MLEKLNRLVIRLGVGVVLSAMLGAGLTWAEDETVAKGREIAIDRKLGNCLACHVMGDGDLPGNIGPPLISMQQRFPDIEKLKQQIVNPLTNNPDSMMPPFGLHGILTDEQIDKVVKYIYTL